MESESCTLVVYLEVDGEVGDEVPVGGPLGARARQHQHLRSLHTQNINLDQQKMKYINLKQLKMKINAFTSCDVSFRRNELISILLK